MEMTNIAQPLLESTQTKFTIIYDKLIYAYICYVNIYATCIFFRTFTRTEHKKEEEQSTGIQSMAKCSMYNWQCHKNKLKSCYLLELCSTMVRMEVDSSRPDHLPTLSAAKTSNLSLLVKHHILAGSPTDTVSSQNF